jgi:hypothetical protein
MSVTDIVSLRLNTCELDGSRQQISMKLKKTGKSYSVRFNTIMVEL